jgi:hypothetical protein
VRVRVLEFLRDLFLRPLEGPITLVDEPEYKLYYDRSGHLMLELPATTPPILKQLTFQQHNRWTREGPPYARTLYEETLVEHNLPHFEPEVTAVLNRDFPLVIRGTAATHLYKYNGPQTARVQLAILKSAKANVHDLKLRVQQAMIDHRDVLQLAEDFDAVTPIAAGAEGIDAATGSIVAASSIISSRTTRTEFFLTSPLFDGGMRADEYEVWHAVTRPLQMAGQWFNGALTFDGERLAVVALSIRDPSVLFGKDPGAETERVYHQLHIDWLENTIGDWTRAFPWGKIDVEFQPQVGDSGILVRYRI